jgi:Type II CAAX prenyl endopeptidase Rce1-like
VGRKAFRSAAEGSAFGFASRAMSLMLVAVLGVILFALRLRYESLSPAWLAHALFNAQLTVFYPLIAWLAPVFYPLIAWLAPAF